MELYFLEAILVVKSGFSESACRRCSERIMRLASVMNQSSYTSATLRLV